MSLFANGIDSIAPQQSAKACHICGEIGHLKRDCPQGGGGGGGGGGGRAAKVCHQCGQPGHLKRDCPELSDVNALGEGMAKMSTGGGRDGGGGGEGVGDGEGGETGEYGGDGAEMACQAPELTHPTAFSV